MFIVPSVTMNAGSLMRVTSRPLSRPKAMQASSPHPMARYGFMPLPTASLVITMPPSAITMPHDRSMPAVRMISVWPIAIVPTTITCCRISEKFCTDRKRSLWVLKKITASSSAITGPRVASGGSLEVLGDVVSDVASDVMVSPVVGRRVAHVHHPGRPIETGGKYMCPARGWMRGTFSVDGSRLAYLLPQHMSVPILVSLLSTPFIGLSVISVTPVSV